MTRKRSAANKQKISRRKAKKIQVEIIRHQPDVRVFHTNFKMSEKMVTQLLQGAMDEKEESVFESASEAVKKLIVGIKGIEGVLTFNLQLYTLYVEKATLIDWEEIEPQVIGLIQMIWQEILGEEVQHVKSYLKNFPSRMQMERDLRAVLEMLNLYYKEKE